MTLLVTRYGPVEDNSDLGQLNEQDFLAWCKEYRKGHENCPETREEWVKLWKQTLAKDYANVYYSILNKLGD